MSDIKVVVVGCGIWGKNLVRNFYSLEALWGVCDLDQNVFCSIEEQYRKIKCGYDFEDVLKSDEIQGVVIATPSHTHYNLCKKALNAGKHVYVEKPIAITSFEAEEVMKLAEEKGLVLMVGHLLMYHPAVNRLKAIIKQGELGKITYLQSDRLNVNYFRNDRSVIWDLAPHDLSMSAYVLDKKPVNVISSSGCSVNNDGFTDIAHIDVRFEDDIHVHISNSWIHPVKRVVLLVRGTKATAVFDDTLNENKIRIYNNSEKSVQSYDTPDYLEIEPLKLECTHFLKCIEKGIKPRSDGLNGYEAVKILEEAEKKIFGTDPEKFNKIKLYASRQKKS